MNKKDNANISSALKRLGDYKCDNQLSIFDVDWKSLQRDTSKTAEIEEEDYAISR